MSPLLPAAGQGMPVNEPLRKAESEHFIYVYQKSLAPRLPELIRSCEDAYRLLTPVFRWTPRGKTAVLFHDAWDEHNGFSTVSPRPQIEIAAAGASPGTTIYEPGNDLRRTVFHEVARMFGRIQPMVGDPLSALLWILGSPPGALAPDWYLEGLSIWAETEFGGRGRGRSTRADMILRMAVADASPLEPVKWDIYLPEWPYGEAAYLYGMRMIEYAHEQFRVSAPDRNVPGELAESVSRSFLYDFDGRAIPVIGESFTLLVEDAMKKEVERQSHRIRSLKAKPVAELRRLTPEDLQVGQPRFGADGRWIFFNGAGEAERDTLFACDPDSGEVSKLPGARTQFEVTRLVAPADRHCFYYTRMNGVGRDRLWSEIRRYDPDSDSVQLVTARGRYRYPAVSPDGRTLAAVRNSAGRSVLVLVPVGRAGDAAAEEMLADASANEALSDPAFSPDGRQLVYVLADNKGSRIRRLNLATKRDDILLDWPCTILSPTFHPLSSNLVFSADRNGVHNLYRMKAESGTSPEPITHVLGGLFEPDFSPDGRQLAAVGYDSKGYYLTVLDYDRLPPAPDPLPALDPVWSVLPANEARLRAAAGNLPPVTNLVSRRYNSLAACRLDFWSPWLAASPYGSQGGLAMSFSDIAGYQSLLAYGGADFDLETPLGFAVYQYAGVCPIFTLFGSYWPQRYPNLIQDTAGLFYDYDEKLGTVGAMVSVTRQRADWDVTLSLGYTFTDRQTVNETGADYQGKTLLTTNLFQGREGAVFAQMEFFNGTEFGRSHSIEQGRYLVAAVERCDEALGSDLTRTRAFAQWDEYLPVPWGGNHVLKLEGVGGVGAGDETAQGFFGLGGFGVLPDVSTPVPRTVSLRGYPDNMQVGRNVAKASVAYRFPIVSIYKSLGVTSPVYFHQLFGELFYETGRASGGQPGGQPDNRWIDSAGAEVNLSATLRSLLEFAPGLGVAYAFDPTDRPHAGEDADDSGRIQVYVSIKTVVNF
jgi:hypothetical protein